MNVSCHAAGFLKPRHGTFWLLSSVLEVLKTSPVAPPAFEVGLFAAVCLVFESNSHLSLFKFILLSLQVCSVAFVLLIKSTGFGKPA